MKIVANVIMKSATFHTPDKTDQSVSAQLALSAEGRQPMRSISRQTACATDSQ
jgi:hypothetical protein